MPSVPSVGRPSQAQSLRVTELAMVGKCQVQSPRVTELVSKIDYQAQLASPTELIVSPLGNKRAVSQSAPCILSQRQSCAGVNEKQHQICPDQPVMVVQMNDENILMASPISNRNAPTPGAARNGGTGGGSTNSSSRNGNTRTGLTHTGQPGAPNQHNNATTMAAGVADDRGSRFKRTCDLQVIQLNLQHSKGSTALLQQELNSVDTVSYTHLTLPTKRIV